MKAGIGWSPNSVGGFATIILCRTFHTFALQSDELALKILQVVPFFPPAYSFGGPAKMAYQIARELVKRNHEVTVYTSDAKDLESRLEVAPKNLIDGIRVHYFRNLAMLLVRKSKLFITPQLFSVAKDEIQKYDVIHLHEYRTFQNIVVHHYAKKYGVPYVFQARGSLPRMFAKQRMKWLYDGLFGHGVLKDASKVLAFSSTEAKQYAGMCVPKNKIELVPNGIDLSEYDNLPPKGSFRRKFGISEDTRIILYLGRIHRIKGIDTLVKAYAYLAKNANHRNVRLVIAGPDDGYLGELESLIDSLKLFNKPLLVGPLYDKNKLEAYVDADVFVLPSIYEAFPNVMLELYACSKPVIASRIESLQDIVVHGKTGFLFEKSNANELAHYLNRALTNPSDFEKMGHEARRFVENRFSIDIVMDKLELLYEDVKDRTLNT